MLIKTRHSYISALVNSQNRKTKPGVGQTVQLIVLDAENNGKLIISDASIDQVQALDSKDDSKYICVCT
jgi:hypothetical protein